MDTVKQGFIRRPTRELCARWSFVWSFVLLIGILFVSVAPAAAHTDLLQSSPGVNQTSGGDVLFFDLAFSEPISNFKMTVTDPSGAEVPGRVLTDQGSIVSYGFDQALTEEGRYRVDYNMTSFDLDFTERDFAFSYDKSAPQPFRIGSDGRYISEPAGTNWLSLLSTLLLVFSAVGIAVLFLSRQGFFKSSRVMGKPEHIDDFDEDEHVEGETEDDSEE